MSHNKKLITRNIAKPFLPSFLFLLSGLAFCLAFADSSFAADINSVFQDVGTKTDAIKDGIVNYVVVSICALIFIVTFILMALRKVGWETLLLITFCCIGISYAFPFVTAIVAGK